MFYNCVGCLCGSVITLEHGLLSADIISFVVKPLFIYFINDLFFQQRRIHHFQVLRQAMQMIREKPVEFFVGVFIVNESYQHGAENATYWSGKNL